jgi:regulatory protein YycI of two-component signal transduction system YycFG
MISPAISQAEAIKKIGSLLEGGMFRKDEEVYDAEFRYLPIWKVSATKETRMLLVKKEEARAYYVSAETGDLISLEKKRIVFHRLLSGTSQKLRNLDEDKRFAFVSKIPSEVDKLPQTRLSKEKSCQTLELKIGVKPVSAELVLLPIWSLKVRHKRKRAKRTINMDAATGRLLTGNV